MFKCPCHEGAPKESAGRCSRAADGVTRKLAESELCSDMLLREPDIGRLSKLERGCMNCTRGAVCRGECIVMGVGAFMLLAPTSSMRFTNRGNRPQLSRVCESNMAFSVSVLLQSDGAVSASWRCGNSISEPLGDVLAECCALNRRAPTPARLSSDGVSVYASILPRGGSLQSTKCTTGVLTWRKNCFEARPI